MNPVGFLLGACFWRRLALALALCLFLAGGAGAVPINPANATPAATPATTAKPDPAAKPDAGAKPDGTSSETAASEDKDGVPRIAKIRNDLAKSCFGGPIIAFGFVVPMIFGEKLHETFAPYVSGILMIVFAIWAYLKVGSALLPFGPKDQAASLFNAIGVRFFVVLGVSVLLLAPTTGYTAYRDYIITPILSAGSTIVDKMYQIGVDTNPTLAKFAKEDGQCTPTPIKGLDAKLTALKDDLECKVCMIQRAYSYPWSYGLFQVGNGKIFTGLLLMLVGIAPFLMFLFTVADVFMVRIGYVSCTLSAYVAAGCFPASRKYAITGLKSLSDGAMVLITSMIAAMISISMLTTVIENLDKGGQGDFAGAVAATPANSATGTSTAGETGKPQTPTGPSTAPQGPVQNPNPVPPTATPGSGATQASNFQTPITTYATGPMGASAPDLTYASWYRNTYLRQPPPPQNTGFDTFRETALTGGGLGGIKLSSPLLGASPSFSTNPRLMFGFCRDPHYHTGVDIGCAFGDPLTPMAPCKVMYSGIVNPDGYGAVFDCRIMNGSTPTNVSFRYAHLMPNPAIRAETIVNPGQVIGKCASLGRSTGPHLHLEIYMDSPNVPSFYPVNAARRCTSLTALSHLSGAPDDFGRNAYYLNPAPLLAGAVSLQGVEGAGFSAVATNFKNFGILDKGFLLVVVICIVSLQVLKQAGKFTSGQGMGVFMKALGQMISGAIAALGAVFTVGAKAAEMAAPLAGAAMGAAGGMVGGALQATGLDKPINRAAEGLQGAMNNVTQGLSGVMDKIGSGISGFVQQSVQTVQNLPITQRVMEFQQGMRDFAAGLVSSDFAQGVARVVMPGVAVLTFATKNVAMPVAGFVGREILLPAAGAAVQQGAAFAFNTLTNDMLKDVNLAGELQNVRENLAKAPLSEAPARNTAPVAAGPQQEGLVRVENTADVVTRTGERQSGPSDWEVLGVREGASLEEMRKALREQAMALHPDRNANGGDQFRDVTAAFSRLQSRDDVQGAAPQGPTSDTTRQLTGTTVAPMPRGETGGSRAASAQGATSDTTRQLTGTTVAPMPRGETGGSRAAQESSRRDSIADARGDLEKNRESLEANYNYPSYQKDTGDNDSGDAEDNAPSLDSRPKEKEDAKPANTIVSARGLRDNNKKPDLRQEGMKRAASVAGDGVSAHEIIAMVGYEADVGAMRQAKADILSKRTTLSSRR